MSRKNGSDTASLMNNQRQTISKLKKDTANLKDELHTEARTTNVKNQSTVSNITRLQDVGDNYSKKIEIEKKRMEDLDREISLLETKIAAQRQQMGGSSGIKESNEMINKKIKSLENKLDKSLQKYNEAVANNKQLREQIDQLRRERKVYDNIYSKLESELMDKKREMKEVIEKAKKAYEEREKAQTKMKELKDKAAKDQSDFEREWEELSKLIEQDKKMKDFIKGKTAEKKGDMTGRGEMSTHSVMQDLTHQEETLRKKVAKSAWGIAKDTGDIHVSIDKVQAYEDAFNKIKSATGISDIDELVKTFVNAEEHNYSLYNNVNELNGQVETLEGEIGELKTEIDKYRGQNMSTDNQRKRILEELEDKLTKTEQKAEQYEGKYQETMKTINILKSGIQNIFDRIGCNTENIEEIVGSEGVTEANMMQYLGIIEQRTNEVLQMFAACQTKQSGETDLASLTQMQNPGKVPGMERGRVEISAPTINSSFEMSMSDSDDDPTLPLSKEELKSKAIKRIQKQTEGGGAKQGKPKKSK